MACAERLWAHRLRLAIWVTKIYQNITPNVLLFDERDTSERDYVLRPLIQVVNNDDKSKVNDTSMYCK